MSYIYFHTLYPYQKEAVDKIVERKQVLLADQPGLGKTLEVLGSLEQLGLFSQGHSLILTPIVAAQTAWRDSIDRFVTPFFDYVQVLDLSTGSSVQKAERLAKHNFKRPTIVLANHGAIERSKAAKIPGIHDIPFEAIVVDESHMVLPILNDRKLTQFWQGLKYFDTVPIRIAVSGTPDRGKLENRFGTYRFLRPGTFNKISRWAWLESNFHLYEKKVSRSRTIRAIGGLKYPNQWAADEDKIIIRRTKNEVLHELPAKQYRYIELDLYKEQRDQYMDAIKVMAEEQSDAIEEERDSAAAMVFALRGRQIAACEWIIDGEKRQPKVGGKSAKLDWILEWLAERGYGNPDIDSGQVVISSQFVQVLYWLQAELKQHGLTAEVIEGSLSSERRAQIQRSFQAGELKIVLLSGRMGVGITLDAADDLILLDLPYDPDMLEQIEDRVHRASNMHQVTIWNLIGVGTIDQLVAQKMALRYRATRTVMDGRRGVDFERKILEKLRIRRDDEAA